MPLVVGVAYDLAGLPFIDDILVIAGEFACGWELGLACGKPTTPALPALAAAIWAELAPRPIPPSPTGGGWPWPEGPIWLWPGVALPTPSLGLWTLCWALKRALA
ncbi:hypothetical protein F5X98DRAFT_257611 [Xylaria grammica]|nr:hypothetical protein F5X98DRAFT_257611 [Xylaria grammica]